MEAEEEAYAFYTGKIVEDARKKAKITQAELARRIGSDRSYISKWNTDKQNRGYLHFTEL
jgi:transcriptional regulator with XRE-family HTH domain